MSASLLDAIQSTETPPIDMIVGAPAPAAFPILTHALDRTSPPGIDALVPLATVIAMHP